MDYEFYSNHFTLKAKQFGYSSEIINACLNYAKPLLDSNLPIIYDATHFSGLVGYKKKYILRSVVYTSYYYREFAIVKSNGKKRNISEPLPSLKEIQLWILNNILYKIPTSKFAKAYTPGITLKQNLVFHKDQELVLTLDIKDFFGNIRRPQIERIFRHSGYSFQVSNLLSKLCCLYECLPQGASTSPTLSNLVMRDFDKVISDFCLHNDVRYTRYADDITFSGEFNPDVIKEFVIRELKKLSLELNECKSRLMTKDQRQIVTGVVVNKKLQVPRDQRKELRQTMYYIQKFGIENHIKAIGNKQSNYIRHLLGRVLYVLFLNSNDKEFILYRDYLYSILDVSKN